MKIKEKQFCNELLNRCSFKPYESGKATVFSDDKQLMYYLEKWTKKGWWEYGVSLRTGWFTPEGIEELLKIVVEEN